MVTARQRFIDCVRGTAGARPIVSPFLPHPTVVNETLVHLGYPVTDDAVQNEIRLARALGYEPMFMTDCPGLLFPWAFDAERSDEQADIYVIRTANGEWLRRVPRSEGLPIDERSALGVTKAGYPVQIQADHTWLWQVCAEIGERETEIRAYFRTWRQRVGEDGVIVIGHPHPSWLAYQISQGGAFFHWLDHRETFIRSMDAITKAALVIMQIAIDEGIDFMSDSSYGLEMTSPQLFAEMDLPYIQRFSNWTHERGGLMWYHNCGQTRSMIADGTFNLLGADVIETIAPPPAGDNVLAEARCQLDPQICTKGNLSLGLLRNGTPQKITKATQHIVEAVRGFKHIFSTADAVLPGTPPENFIAFVRSAQAFAENAS